MQHCFPAYSASLLDQVVPGLCCLVQGLSAPLFMTSALVKVYVWFPPSFTEKWGMGERLFLRLMCQNHSVHNPGEELELLQEKFYNLETCLASLLGMFWFDESEFCSKSILRQTLGARILNYL